MPSVFLCPSSELLLFDVFQKEATQIWRCPEEDTTVVFYIEHF